MNINLFYKEALAQILAQPFELNKRTGVKCAAVPGVTFRTDLDIHGFPLISLRKLPFSFVPEIMWFLSGSQEIGWLSKHTKIWDSFAEEGYVTAAYGYRWREHFGVDQLELVLEKLKADPSTRHGVVMMWDPYSDLTIKQKNVPCPYSFTLNMIGGRLNLHLTIRSNDMVLGFPMDVAGFALLTHILAQELKVRAGVLTVSISNAHVYENQIDAAKEMMSRTPFSDKPTIHVPSNSYSRACSLDDRLVGEIKAKIANYNPHPPIKDIPIAI